jgi:hypothetical protein
MPVDKAHPPSLRSYGGTSSRLRDWSLVDLACRGGKTEEAIAKMNPEHHPNPVVALTRRRSYSQFPAASLQTLTLPTMNNFG